MVQAMDTLILAHLDGCRAAAPEPTQRPFDELGIIDLELVDLDEAAASCAPLGGLRSTHAQPAVAAHGVMRGGGGYPWVPAGAVESACARTRPAPAVPHKTGCRRRDLHRAAKRISVAHADSQRSSLVLRGAKIIGKGAHSTVYKCKQRSGDGSYIAVKCFLSPGDREAATSPKAQAEFSNAKSLFVHVNLVRVLALDLAGGCLAMEFVDGGSLEDALARAGPMSEGRATRALAHVLEGLAILHAHGCPHRDVKPANIVVDTCTDTFKLCDWIGSEAEEASLALGKPVGTPLFMAPEVAGCPHRHCISSDTWALGCTILNLITGRLPWEGADAHGRTNEFMALWLTSQGHAPPYDTHAMSPALSSFVALCFEPSTLLRPCAAELRGHDLFCRPC